MEGNSMGALKNHTNTDWPPPPATVIVEHGQNRTWSEIAGMAAFALMCLCALNLLIAVVSSFLPAERLASVSELAMMLVGFPCGVIGLVIGALTLDTRWGSRTIILAVALIVAVILGVGSKFATAPHIEY
jgi:hypothetical protein